MKHVGLITPKISFVMLMDVLFILFLFLFLFCFYLIFIYFSSILFYHYIHLSFSICSIMYWMFYFRLCTI